MEEGLIIGYDLCQDYCRISFYEDGKDEPTDLAFSTEENQNPYLVQNSICKKKGEDMWLIGEEAYETALLGDGTIVDKLLRLVSRSGVATFEGVTYGADDLLGHFLEETLKVLFKKTGTHKISEIMFSIQELDTRILDTIIRCMRTLGVERKKIHIISHTESYLYFVLSQKRDLWSNISVLFDLSGNGLNYYEMEVLRGMQPNIASAKRTVLEEGFELSILDTSHGMKMADSIMTSCVERLLSRKLISSVYLSGKGMDNCQKWGNNFLRVLCARRRVFFIENLFAKGAVYAAMEFLREQSAYPYRIMCEGRISVDISLEVYQGMQMRTLKLSEVGNNWYETKASFDFIPDQESVLKLKVKKLGERLPTVAEIPLSEFEQRGNKLSRISFSLSFLSENTFQVVLRDKGFGELFPATDLVVTRSFTVG